ncbi:MAG: phosphohistidine phosphatase SixA, partial [Gemmatimonadota bacterium]
AARALARAAVPGPAVAAERMHHTEGSPMRLCLVRHGDATSEEENPARPLTDAGAATVRRVAAHLRAAGAVSAAEVRHSTKLRAKQTAEHFAEALGLRVPIREVPNLEPLDDVSALADALGAETRDLVLVGHMPHLSRLASRLVAGAAALEAFAFPPAGVLCLERASESGRDPKGPGRWRVAWMLVPALLSGAGSG